MSFESSQKAAQMSTLMMSKELLRCTCPLLGATTKSSPSSYAAVQIRTSPIAMVSLRWTVLRRMDMSRR